MNAFVVEVKNQPGEMARITEKLAEEKINILPCCLGVTDHFAVAFIAGDEDSSRRVLQQTGEVFRELPLLTITLDNKPGTAATTCRQLADAGINIELFLPVDRTDGRFTFAIGVEDIEGARKSLKGQITEFAYR
jgi:hypothetical protein